MGEDLLFQAFQIVAKESGVDVHLPDSPPSTTQELLEYYCRWNQMRKREVALDKHFYKKSSTPFLGFLKDSKEPVVLINKRQSVYEILYPKTGERKRLNEEVELDSTAYVFYASLPEEVKSKGDVLRNFFSKKGRQVAPLVLFGVLGSLFSLGIPIAVYFLFSSAIPNANFSLTSQIVMGFLIIAVFSTLFFYFQSVLIGRLKAMASNEIELSLWNRLIQLPANFFHRFTSGDLASRLLSIPKLHQTFSDANARAFHSGIFSVCYFIVMAIFSYSLTLIVFFIFSIASVLVWYCLRRLIHFEKLLQRQTSKINSFVLQILRGIAKLRQSRAQNHAFARWGELFLKNKRFEIQAQNWKEVISSITSTLPFIAYGGIFSYVFLFDKMEEISLAAFLAFNTAFLAFLYIFLDLIKACVEMAAVGSSWDRVKPILQQKSEIIGKKAHIKSLKGDIRLENITFRYEKDSLPALANISIKVRSKESIAIFGPSGSGKSTIVRLLLGLEKSSSGTIYFDEQPLDHLDLSEVRQNIGVVRQSEGIMEGTLLENLLRGSFLSKGAIERALNLSSFSEDLANFPMGLSTLIPMNGETLSSGQKQRLLLARALLQDPTILIIDEGMNALDNHAQNIISKNIEDLNITRILITHQISALKSVDRIYVLNKGKCVQEGSYQELIQKPGLFSSMIENQKSLS